MSSERTLVVTNDFPPRAGGIQAFIHGLLLRQPADSVVVYAPELGSNAVAVVQKNANTLNIFTAVNWLVIQPNDPTAKPWDYLPIAAAVERYLETTVR